MTVAIITKLGSEKPVGTIETGTKVAFAFDTKDEELYDILSWAAVNPLTLISGSEDPKGVFVTTEDLVNAGDKNFMPALSDFLKEYDFVLTLAQ